MFNPIELQIIIIALEYAKSEDFENNGMYDSEELTESTDKAFDSLNKKLKKLAKEYKLKTGL